MAVTAVCYAGSSELVDLGVVVDLVGVDPGRVVLGPLPERFTCGLERLTALVDGERHGLPGFGVSQVEARHVPGRALDGCAQPFDSLRVERVSVELMKRRQSGDHQTAPPSESRLAQRMTGQSDRASSAPPLRKGRHDRHYRYCWARAGSRQRLGVRIAVQSTLGGRRRISVRGWLAVR